MGNIAQKQSQFVAEDAEFIKESAFEGNTDLVEICIPRSVKVIGKNAFKGCSNLPSVWLAEDGLERIEESAFEGCVNLVSMVIPNTVSEIAATAFKDCNKIKYVSPSLQVLIPDEFLEN